MNIADSNYRRIQPDCLFVSPNYPSFRSSNLFSKSRCPRHPQRANRHVPLASSAVPSTVTSPILCPDFPTEATLSSPIVHRYLWDTGPQYVMWYTSRPHEWPNSSDAPSGTWSGEIRLALSSDGLSWRRTEGPLSKGAVFLPNSEEWWAFDTIHLSSGSVLLNSSSVVKSDGGVYLLYYAGGDNEHLQVSDTVEVPGGRTRIGLAISKDGEHFTRIEGTFPSGAVLDVGTPSSFDDMFISAPCVLHFADVTPAPYIMYYHGASTKDSKLSIGRAQSKDGLAFSRSPTNEPVVSSAQVPSGVSWADGGVCRPSVLRRSRNSWVMYVEVIGSDRVHRIGMCESEDGLKWGSIQLVLDVGEAGAFDAAGVSHPCAVLGEDEKSVQLYYVGKKEEHAFTDGKGTSIGVAHSSGEDWELLSRVSGVL